MLARPSRPHPRVATLALLLALAALPAASRAELAAEVVATGLDRPLFAASPPGDGRLFILERPGRIRILLDGALLEPPFLDIRPLVSPLVSERGLLGLAFDPDFPHNGVFYVYYTDRSGDSVLARYQVGNDPDVADPTSGEILLVIGQPFANHNGGTIAFGADGMLYWGPGDGGAGFDPGERSQDPTTLLGKMLRLDVSDGPGHPVAIPEDNPFLDEPGVRDEIWAFGLRNPYRFSFDRETGDLWIADVGQRRIEEINFEPADDPGGRNYGWDVMEGTLCVDNDPAPAPACNDPSLTLPVFEYGHVFGLCSVTGGYVYRGPIPSLQGRYIFGDYCTGVIFSYDLASDEFEQLTAELAPAGGTGFVLVGFGEDGDGDLHVVHDRTGTVYRIRSPDPACSDGFDNDGDGLADDEDPACLDPLQDAELPRNDLAVIVWPYQIRLAPHGRVFTTLLGSEAIDLSRADPETLAFGPDGAAPAYSHAPFRLDLNHDGFEDWIVP
ncbi:MAG: PQQ-dependent sugar dehydrogenase, partial [Myxococcota bacterium]